jgi:dihydroorotate dehydrogenase electron transfer subunit
MIIGARTAEDLVFTERFRAMGAKVAITTDDGSLGLQGVVTDAASQLLAQDNYRALYACGPEPMLQTMEALAQSRRLSAQLSYERHMRCGFGICGACAQGGWRVCKDGPVKQIDP